MAATPPTVAPRTDLRTALVWIGIGAVIVIGSWRMDRMTQQGADLYTAPGLWPGIIGFLIAALGGILVWRSVLRARETGWTAADADVTVLVPRSRFALALTLFFVYALLLVGRGLPFWLGTALFVTTYVFLFRRAERQSGARTGSDRSDAVLALVCGIATAAIVTVVFEELFYVRLP